MLQTLLGYSDTPLEGDLVCTAQLFPKESVEAIPTKQRFLGTVSYMGAVAFTADKTPEDVDCIPRSSSQKEIGVQELTIDGTTVTHVNKKKLKGVLDSILKIEWNEFTGTIDEDGERGLSLLRLRKCSKSDLFVVFTQGVSMATISILENRSSVGGSSKQRYLFLRKKHNTMFKEEHDKLNVYVYACDDSRVKEISSLKTIDSYSKLLGSATYDIDELKKNHGQKIYLELSGDPDPMTVVFSCKLISVDEHCEEQGKDDESSWLHEKATFGDNSDQMFEEVKSMNLDSSDLPYPLLYFYNKNTSWILMCEVKKVLIVNFKGTGTEDYCRDFITDVKFKKVLFEGTEVDAYKFDPSEPLAARSGKVHLGFLEVYVSIRVMMLETLHAVSRWCQSWLMMFTGHSLGGALATLAAYEVSNRTLNGRRPSVAMINFGCPRLANKEFRDRYDSTVPVSYRVCARLDIIPSIPSHLLHVGREVRKDYGGGLIVAKWKDEDPDTHVVVQGARNVLLGGAARVKLLSGNITPHYKPSYITLIARAAEKLRN